MHGGRRRISRKAKRLGLLAVRSVPVQRQEEEVLAVGEEEDDQLHAGGMRLDHADGQIGRGGWQKRPEALQVQGQPSLCVGVRIAGEARKPKLHTVAEA